MPKKSEPLAQISKKPRQKRALNRGNVILNAVKDLQLFLGTRGDLASQ
jgi:hypothetical protein